MRNTSSILVALLTIAGIGQAAAADLPARTSVPVPYVNPVYNWTGFYVGANIGGGWANTQLTELATNAAWNNTHSSFIGGGQLGYNYQISNFVVGVEWTYDWGGKYNSTVVVQPALEISRAAPTERPG
jgi:outer membrane immunogenic protein